MFSFRLLIFLLSAIIVTGTHFGPYEFPLYKQCDPKWGSNQMGVPGNGERNSICNEGCAMSSTAMALAGLGVQINGAPVNPGTFNTWLKANQGYLCLAGDCNNLNLTAPENLSPKMSLIGENQKKSYQDIVSDIVSGAVIHIAHVRNKTHFVLLTWPTSTGYGFQVNDPGFNSATYQYSEISDIITFHVNKFPVYKQCDPKWGSTTMGGDNLTICQVGCLMSSTSSALAGTNILVDGATATPATVNKFLQTNGGFVPGTSDMDEGVIPKIAPERVFWPADGMHTQNDIPFTTIAQYLNQDIPRICIANVMHGHHFVLVVGYRADNDTLIVNDSGFNRNSYSYSKDVVGWRIFDMR